MTAVVHDGGCTCRAARHRLLETRRGSALPPGVPAVDGYFDRERCSPKSSLDRRAALLARRGRS